MLNLHLLRTVSVNKLFLRSSYTTKLATKLTKRAPRNFQPYLRLIRFDKPVGTWLLLWPGWCGLAFSTAHGLPDPLLIAKFGLGAFLMRSSGCIINDMWDVKYDSKVMRTKLRPLACKELSRGQALGFLALTLSGSLAILLTLNSMAIMMGCASLSLVISYPYMKRITYWPQGVLGLAMNYGFLMGCTAVNHSLPLSALPIYLSLAFWTVYYDTIYAYQDISDDKLLGLKSTSIKFEHNPKRFLSMCASLSISGLIFSGLLSGQSIPYYLAVGSMGLTMTSQVLAFDKHNKELCGKMFLQNTRLGALLCAGIIASNLY